jgi:hypothetical protein
MDFAKRAPPCTGWTFTPSRHGERPETPEAAWLAFHRDEAAVRDR